MTMESSRVPSNVSPACEVELETGVSKRIVIGVPSGSLSEARSDGTLEEFPDCEASKGTACALLDAESLSGTPVGWPQDTERPRDRRMAAIPLEVEDGMCAFALISIPQEECHRIYCK